LRLQRKNRPHNLILEETSPGDLGADDRGVRIAVNIDSELTDETDWELLQLIQKPAKGQRKQGAWISIYSLHLTLDSIYIL